MNRFIGTKLVLATAMTRASYNDFRGWKLPEDEDGSDDGYLVEYTDGGKPNVLTHAGYVSWSPKEQFDNAYRERQLVPGLAPHEQRVFDERADLIERTTKLATFFEMPLFAELDEAEQSRLRQQHHAMTAYAAILSERIDAFA